MKLIYGKNQVGRKGWWDDNLFIGIAAVVIFSIIFLTVGFSIKFGCRKIASKYKEYQANAPQREEAREEARSIREGKKAMRDYDKIRLSKQRKSTPKAVVASKPEKKKVRKGRQTYEEYCVNKPFKPWTKDNFKDYNQDLWTAERLAELNDRKKREHYQEWERANSDLMHDAFGELKDPIPDDDLSAEQNYWVLAWALYMTFVVWAGIGTGGHPLFILFATFIGVLWSILIYCW